MGKPHKAFQGTYEAGGYKPAINAGVVNTGSSSADLMGLTLLMTTAALPSHLAHLQESLVEMGGPYMQLREAVRAIESDYGMNERGKSQAVREQLPAVRERVAANRRKVATLRQKAAAARADAIREREALVTKLTAADPAAVNLMVDVLTGLDPLVARARIAEAANQLGDPKHPRAAFLLAAAKRAALIGLEHRNHAGMPIVDDGTLAAVADNHVGASTLANSVAELDEVAGLHGQVAAVAEKAIERVGAAYGSEMEFRTALADVPADGGTPPGRG